ncbi:unnamed protein product, partial [Mesorhabditis belari]|uniref:C-type lectin domain-containing protein n=1 Tax=Mesorhabditis belari TaxID=2138241 RepID=A0AAF3ELW9_9BILA
MFWAILLAILFVYSDGAGKCPEGSTDYGDRAECVYPVNAKTNYTVAKQICRNFNGQIIIVRDIFENVIAGSQAALSIAANSQSYIGVMNANGTWINDDGTPLVYQNWKAGHPQTNASCAVESAQDYKWTSVSCDALHTFICSIPDRNCPNGWVAHDKMCYYFYDPKLALMNQTFTRMQGQNACLAMNANLTSILSESEFNFLKDQIATNSSMISSQSCQNPQALIGLTCVDNIRSWLDGSQFAYDQTLSQCDSSYGIINDTRCERSAYWDYWPDDFGYYRYICKKSLVSSFDLLKAHFE